MVARPAFSGMADANQRLDLDRESRRFSGSPPRPSSHCRMRARDSWDCLSVYERYSFYTMELEFDPEKSASNKAKHGIDFLEAQALWDDVDLLEIPACIEDEPRYMVIGRIGPKHWSGIITYRDERTRIISVRRARKTEVLIYEG